MKIEPGMIVSATYVLHTVNAEGADEYVERAEKDQPLVFMYGAGNMLPKFEEHLAGLQAGDTYAFELSAEDGYGDVDPGAHAQLPIDMFQEVGMPKVGDVLPLQDDNGNAFRALVKDINTTHVTADLNHPMAGKVLKFTGEILDVRPATEEEKAHGHAHGADGASGH